MVSISDILFLTMILEPELIILFILLMFTQVITYLGYYI